MKKGKEGVLLFLLFITIKIIGCTTDFGDFTDFFTRTLSPTLKAGFCPLGDPMNSIAEYFTQ